MKHTETKSTKTEKTVVAKAPATKVQVPTIEGPLTDLPKILKKQKGFFILVNAKGAYPVIASRSWIITKKMMAAMDQVPKSKGVIVAIVDTVKMDKGYYLYPKAKVSEVLGKYMASGTFKNRGNYSQSRNIASHVEYFNPAK